MTQWLVVNGSTVLTHATIVDGDAPQTHLVDVPTEGTIYVLNGKDGNKRATVMTLNGRDLVLGENWEQTDLSGAPVAPVRWS